MKRRQRRSGSRKTVSSGAAAAATATFAVLGLLGVTVVPVRAQTSSGGSAPAAPPPLPAPVPDAKPAESKPGDAKPADAKPGVPENSAPVPAAPAVPAAAPLVTPAPPAAPSAAPAAPADAAAKPGDKNKTDKADKAGKTDKTEKAGAAPPPPSEAFVPLGENGNGSGNGERGALQSMLPQWLRKALNLHLIGSNTFSLRSQKVSGGKEGMRGFQFESNSNYDARRLGPFQHNVDVTVDGNVGGVLKLDGRLSNSRYGNYVNQNFGINYDQKGTQFKLGNVNAQLGGNGLVNFSKTLQGIVIGRDFGGGRIRTTNVLSITKARTLRNSFQGNNTTGPYSLGGSLIIEGTERVYRDGVLLRRATSINGFGFGGANDATGFGLGGSANVDASQSNVVAPGGFGGPGFIGDGGTAGNPGDGDYSVDYYTGQITFREIVPPGSTITYSYEAQNYSGAAGFLAGTRWDVALGNAGTVGITWLEQKARGGNGGGVQTLRAPVSGDPSYAYYLPLPIQTGTKIKVYWRDQLLIEGVDYSVNYPLHFFRLLIPRNPDNAAITTQGSLLVEYQPQRTQTLGGDRRVLGVDTNLNLGSSGNVSLQLGQSHAPGAAGSGAAGSGTAARMTASFKGGGKGGRNLWSLNTTLTDIAPGFGGIDSADTAFMHAEKGVAASLSYAPIQYVSVSSNFSRARIAQSNLFGGSGFGSGGGANTDPNAAGALSWATSDNLNLNVGLSFPNLPQLSFGHTQVQQAGTSKSRFSSDRLDLSWSRGAWLRVNGSLARTASQGRSVFSNYLYSNGQTGLTSGSLGSLASAIPVSVSNSSSDTARFGVTLTPAAWISLNGSLGVSNTRYGSSTSLNGAAAGVTTITGVTTTETSAAASAASSSSGLAGLAGNGTRATDFTSGVTLNLGNLQIQGSLSDATNGQSTASFYGAPGTASEQLGLNTASGQRTRGMQLSATYSPFSNLLLNLETSRSLALVPGYDNSQSLSNTFSFQYTGLSRLQLAGSLSNQNVSYVGDQGDSNTQSYDLTATVGPFGRLSLTTSLQRLNGGSNVFYGRSGGSSVGGVGNIGGVVGVPGAGSGAQTPYLSQDQVSTVLSARANLDVGGNKSVFFEWQTLDTRTPRFDSTLPKSGDYRLNVNSLRSMGTVGIDFRLNALLGVSLNANLIRLSDRDDNKYSYNARTFNMDLTTRF